MIEKLNRLHRTSLVGQDIRLTSANYLQKQLPTKNENYDALICVDDEALKRSELTGLTLDTWTKGLMSADVSLALFAKELP